MKNKLTFVFAIFLSSLMTNPIAAQITDSDPDCEFWFGNCNPNIFDANSWGIYRQGNVSIGYSSPQSADYSLYVKNSGLANGIFAQGAISLRTRGMILIEGFVENALVADFRGDVDVLGNHNINAGLTVGQNAIIDGTLSAQKIEVQRLDAAEIIYSKELRVKYPPFPDYVFESDYDLIPITKLKNYITTNGHLPNIPSAEEIINVGIGVGELQILQMEKIEELTLYIIQLHEKIEEMNDVIDQQVNNPR